MLEQKFLILPYFLSSLKLPEGSLLLEDKVTVHIQPAVVASL